MLPCTIMCDCVCDWVQVNVTFSPLMANTYLGELKVKYESSEEVYLQLCGNAEELAVRLDTDALICDPTYIHLSSRKTVRIMNRSDTTIHFEWKAMQAIAQALAVCSHCEYTECARILRSAFACAPHVVMRSYGSIAKSPHARTHCRREQCMARHYSDVHALPFHCAGDVGRGGRVRTHPSRGRRGSERHDVCNCP